MSKLTYSLSGNFSWQGVAHLGGEKKNLDVPISIVYKNSNISIKLICKDYPKEIKNIIEGLTHKDGDLLLFNQLKATVFEEGSREIRYIALCDLIITKWEWERTWSGRSLINIDALKIIISDTPLPSIDFNSSDTASHAYIKYSGISKLAFHESDSKNCFHDFDALASEIKLSKGSLKIDFFIEQTAQWVDMLIHENENAPRLFKSLNNSDVALKIEETVKKIMNDNKDAPVLIPSGKEQNLLVIFQSNPTSTLNDYIKHAKHFGRLLKFIQIDFNDYAIDTINIKYNEKEYPLLIVAPSETYKNESKPNYAINRSSPLLYQLKRDVYIWRNLLQKLYTYTNEDDFIYSLFVRLNSIYKQNNFWDDKFRYMDLIAIWEYIAHYLWNSDEGKYEKIYDKFLRKHFREWLKTKLNGSHQAYKQTSEVLKKENLVVNRKPFSFSKDLNDDAKALIFLLLRGKMEKKSYKLGKLVTDLRSLVAHVKNFGSEKKGSSREFVTNAVTKNCNLANAIYALLFIPIYVFMLQELEIEQTDIAKQNINKLFDRVYEDLTKLSMDTPY